MNLQPSQIKILYDTTRLCPSYQRDFFVKIFSDYVSQILVALNINTIPIIKKKCTKDIDIEKDGFHGYIFEYTYHTVRLQYNYSLIISMRSILIKKHLFNRPDFCISSTEYRLNTKNNYVFYEYLLDDILILSNKLLNSTFDCEEIFNKLMSLLILKHFD